LVVAVLLDLVAEMRVDGVQVPSLEAFLLLAVAAQGITFIRVHLVDQVLEALMVLELLQRGHLDKAMLAELLPQERLVAEAALEA
jgi:hypothetical protein